MSCQLINLTETGILALVSLMIGFAISFCRQAEQSRCSKIKLCWGGISCDREPLSGDTILQLNAEEEKKEEL